MALVKQAGTAIASSFYNDFGTVASVNDGSTTTGWSGGAINSAADWVAIQFAAPQKVKALDVYIYSWGKTIIVGYSNTVPASKAGFTVVRTIDTSVTPNDDLGVAWGRVRTNTILIPTNTVAATIWGVYTNDTANNTLTAGPGILDRARMMEMNFYTDAAVQAPPADPHPKPPATVPTLPYLAAPPTNWVKTEYATPGDFSFTPAIDTTVVLVAVQGAGSAGRVNLDLSGNTTPNDTTLFGGDSFVSTASGRIVVAPGGEGPMVTDVAQFPAPLGTATNWLRAVDNASRSGGVTPAGYSDGAAGGQSVFQGTAGVAFTLAPQSTNDVPATTTFTGTAVIAVNPTYVNASRNSGFGLTTNMTLASAGAPSIASSIEYKIKAYAGQVITLSFGFYLPDSRTTGTCTVGSSVYVMGVSSGSTTSPNFTIQNDGLTTIRFDMSTTATNGGIPYIRVTRMFVANIGQGGAASGATGRGATLFMLPEPLTFTVGKGGVGQSGGQSVPATIHGTRGSGGGVGGNGGDGVVTIYEWKGVPVYEKPPTATFDTYNTGLTAEALAAYRTNYVGSRGTGLANTQTAFTHKLRPRTKYVLALITGAGGDAKSGGNSTVLPSEQILPTTITSGAITNVAESGWSGNWNNGAGVGGAGGAMQDAPNIVFGSSGTGGYPSYYNGSSPNTSVITGGYGSGATANFQVNSGGGCGGYGLIAIPASQFSADRTITGLVANAGGGAIYGAVFLFETENDYGPYISGLAEHILLKSDISATAITQASEQFLLKSTNAGTTISTTAEHVFYKESESANNLQVSHAAIAFVVDADDPLTNVSSSVEHFLLRDKSAPTNVSSSIESILMRTGSLPWRITQTAQMILAAELPSVFWLNFGTLQYPMARTVYDSQVGRATSVQTGAYIQLESPHMDGTTLVVNGVAVGLSSPIANNDSVFIRGGVTNYYQKEMNVYTYYTKNGQIARELVGQWKLLRADLTPTLSRKYSVPYTNASWIKTHPNFGIGNIVPLWTRATNKLGAVFSTMMANGHSALAGLTSMFTKALSTMFSGNGAVISQNNHDTFAGPDAEIAQVETVYAAGPQSSITKAREVLGEKVSGASASTPNVNAQTWDKYEQMIPGAEPVVMLDFEQSHAHTDQYENTDFNGDTHVGFGQYTALDYQAGNPVGFGKVVAIDYLTGNPVGFGKVAKEYDYNAVGKSYFAEQTYKAVYNSGSRQMFSMGTLGTIAYSSLTGTSYSKNSGVGTGNWLMPLGLADWARNGFGLVSMVVMERAIAHPHLVDRTVARDGSKNLGYFDSSPVMHKVGFGNFEQSVVKTSVNSGTVDRLVIHSRQYSALVNWPAYRPAEAINGRGKASLYMGFDTLQDVQDYTEQYAGVTTLAAYNGYVYNLAVDKSFVCEIYYNGPVSGLIKGG
jgi:hypothetical protein